MKIRLPRKQKKLLKWRLYAWRYPTWPKRITITQDLIVWNKRFTCNL